ncbi:MAG: hypothetical protein M1823_005386 [Watsoniomyces obsoletus]|nr:MAG: hypothetical protein M1823_005386 [Watsoniomyces obsoletus]
MEYETESRGYEDEQRYDRNRSASPRQARRDDSPRGVRTRSDSPNGRIDTRGPPPDTRSNDDRDSSARNPGSNLFVTGIHPRLSEAEVSRLFEKYGEVEKCAIMLDPHTKESRGFGFVKMVTAEQADAAKEALQGEVIDGRTLSIEKARRARPRTPTPGKYFGPPKRDDYRRPPPGRYDRYDDRRGGGYGGRYNDSYSSRGSGRYDDRERDRGYGGGSGGGRRDYSRDDYPPRGIDRYASTGRDDRYSGRSEDRRGGGGGGGGYYEREGGRSGQTGSASGGYGEQATGRGYEDRGEDRYSRR